ncbi:MAG: PH domain-containing protein [Candidatus Liptonbacteria bacterium]
MIDLHENEKIVVIARRHWFVFVSEIITLALGFLPFILLFIFWDETYSLAGKYLNHAEASNLLIFIGAGWLLFLWIKLFVSFTNYYLDILVITNQRVIDIDQIGLFARDIATAPLENAQDIKIEMIGVISTMLRFGNLYFQTAGMEKEIVVRGIKDPEGVKRQIMSTFHAEGGAK